MVIKNFDRNKLLINMYFPQFIAPCEINLRGNVLSRDRSFIIDRWPYRSVHFLFAVEIYDSHLIRRYWRVTLPAHDLFKFLYIVAADRVASPQ